MIHYKGRTYRHQQIWTLIRELRSNGLAVLLCSRKTDDTNEWFASIVTKKRVYSARANTPFAALAGAVSKTAKKVEFVCNLPGPAMKIHKLLENIGGMGTACRPRVFAELQADWIKVGDNYIGEPYGEHAEGDLGVYVCC